MTRRGLAVTSLALAASVCSNPALAQEPDPLAPAEQQDPLADLLRTTLIVRDMDKSLALYRDALGMELIADREISTSAVSAPTTAEPNARARFVMLRGPSAERGFLGMIQWTDPPMPDPGGYKAQLQPGSVVLIIRLKDASKACSEATGVPGVTVTSPLRERTFPGNDGDASLTIASCTLFDPDGNLIETSQRLEQ